MAAETKVKEARAEAQRQKAAALLAANTPAPAAAEEATEAPAEEATTEAAAE